MRLQHPVNPDYVRIKGDWGSYVGHKGRDYGWISDPKYIPESREVRAAAAGKVVGVNLSDPWYRGWGRFVLIQHTDKAWTAYAHFAEDTITVRVGDIVQAGQLLGRMGSSGKTGNPPTIHLHFEVRIGGFGEQHRVPPLRYFTVDLPGKSILPAPAGQLSYPNKRRVLLPTNLRKSPKTGNVVTVIPAGTVVQSGKAVNGWTPVKYGKKTGWVSSDLVSIRTRTVTLDGLWLRDKPSGKRKATLKKGTRVTVLEGRLGRNGKVRYVKVRVGARVGWVIRGRLG